MKIIPSFERCVTVAVLIAALLAAVQCQQAEVEKTPEHGIVASIPVPEGFERVRVDSASFAHWLRELPLKSPDSPVLLFDGREKVIQDAHVAVLDLDVGDKDLQQCADAVIRLRAEYLYGRREYDLIAFRFTSGDAMSFRKWIEGWRPSVHDDDVTWAKSGVPDSSHESFRSYLESLFTYAGSYSLSKELAAVDDIHSIEPGDVFIEGGFPGHAVIVLDVAEDNKSGERTFILGQSFMPAQDIHVLKNPADTGLSPWYRCSQAGRLITPEWIFEPGSLKRF